MVGSCCAGYATSAAAAAFWCRGWVVIDAIEENMSMLLLQLHTPVDVVGVVEFDTIVPTSSKFTKNVMGKALQSGSRLVVRTALSFMVALFDRIDHVLEWSTSVTKHCVPEHSRLSEAREKLLKRVQSHVPDFCCSEPRREDLRACVVRQK